LRHTIHAGYGLTIIVLAVPISSIALLLIGSLTVGVGQGLSFKGSMQLVNTIAPADQKGKMVSLLYIFVYLGVGLPILGVGMLSSLYGLYHAICYFACFIGLASLVVIYRLVKDCKTISVAALE
jgi:MFS family permease